MLSVKCRMCGCFPCSANLSLSICIFFTNACFFSCPFVCGKDVGFRFDTLRTILQQEVLLQEDVELIEFLDPSILSAGQCKQQENRQLPTLRSLATPNIWYCIEDIYHYSHSETSKKYIVHS